VIPFGAIAAALAASRAFRNGRPSSTSVGAGLSILLRLVALIVWMVFLEGGPALAYLATAVFVPLMFPVAFLVYVLVPLGLPRVAYYFGRASLPILYAEEARAAGVFFGTLAELRSKSDDKRILEWLENRLSAARPARGIALTAAGLLAAARGKREAARLLLTSVDDMQPGAGRPPGAVRRAARNWLVADAARSGDWMHVAKLARGGLSFQRWSYLMGAIASRLARLPNAASDAWLWVLWVIAPRRRATLPLLRRALEVPRDTREALEPEPRAEEAEARADEPFTVALRRHAECLTAPDGGRMAASGREWDALRASPEAQAQLARRALGLGAHVSADAALVRLLDTAAEDLTVHAHVAEPGAGGCPTLDAVLARARQQDFDEIESGAAAMRSRTQRKEALHPLQEWMAWTSLRLACERVARGGGAQVRRTAFTSAYEPACNWAVWLFNARTEKLLAHLVFRWLLTEARAAHDVQAIHLMEKNMRAGWRT
jgi:hypothetical protein